MDRAYFAVFDGHGGADAARYASVQVHAVAAHRPELATDPAEALRAAFRRTDEMFLWKARREVSAEWGRRGRASARKAAEGPPPKPAGRLILSLPPRGPVVGAHSGLSPAEGVRASPGGQRDCVLIRGGRMTGAGLLPHGSQEVTPPQARATRQAPGVSREGQGTEDGVPPSLHPGPRGQARWEAENQMV